MAKKAKKIESSPYTVLAQEEANRSAIAASTARYLDTLEDRRSDRESTDDYLEGRRMGANGMRLLAYLRAAESGSPW